MVIQPMAIVAAQGTCAQGSRNGSCCIGKTACTGCKCGRVKSDGDLRGCCGGREGHAEGCRTKMGDEAKVDEPLGEISDVTPEPPNSDDQSVGQKTALISSCLCGVHSEPLAPSSHRVPVSQTRDLVVIAYLDHVATDASFLILPEAITSRLPQGNLSPHFSQRLFCIWRI